MDAPQISSRELFDHQGQTVTLQDWEQNRRKQGGMRFLLLRESGGVKQCVFKDTELRQHERSGRGRGKVGASPKAPGGFELQATALEVISAAEVPPPVEISKEEWHANPDTLLAHRAVTVRGVKARATLKVQAELVRAFRAFLDDSGFTEIFTPKIVEAGAEGEIGRASCRERV